MEGANPQHAKRAREEGSSTDHPAAGLCGKGAAKLLVNYASKLLGAIHSRLFKEAIALRKRVASAASAVATLQVAKDENKVVSSLQLRRSPAFKSVLEAAPELAADLAKIERAALDHALHQRQQERAHDDAQLRAICDGDTFMKAASESLRLERFTLAEAAILEQEVTAAETEFKLAVKLKCFELDDADAKAAAAKKKRAEDREVRQMEIEQEPSAALMKRMVDAAVAKRFGSSMPSSRRTTPSPRRVTFAKGKPERSRSTSRPQSRGRSGSRGTSRASSCSASRSASRGRSQERSQTPFPGRGKGRPRRRPSRDGGTSPSRPHARGPSPSSRAGREPRRHHGRDSFQGNGRGGRGTRPHRPPSGMHGGSARVGGGGGSRTGPRR
jgi:hypothetical protein